jgi:hypothetical protein
VQRIVAHEKHLGALPQHDGERCVEVGDAAGARGRAKLAIKPARTGSATPTITIWIVAVAALAASVGGLP